MVRDEADVIEQTVHHFLAQGVAGILVADNGSTDGTVNILRRMAREEPRLHLAVDREPAYYQAVKMSLLADWVTAAGATWVVPFDADERWFAPHGDLASWLKQNPADTVTALVHNVFPSRVGFVVDPVPHLNPKVAFRAFRGARLATGNHSVQRPGFDGEGLRILHLPWRSREQLTRKLKNGSAALALTSLDRGVGDHWRTAGDLDDQGLSALWEDLKSGLVHPDIGWYPRGWLLPINPDEWTSWDPEGTLRQWTGSDVREEQGLTICVALPSDPEERDQIIHTARRAAELLQAPLVTIADSPVHRKHLGVAQGSCLVMGASPVPAEAVHAAAGRGRRFGSIHGWYLRPRGEAEYACWYDCGPESLPYGFDVFRYGPVTPDRPVDVQRLIPGQDPTSVRWEPMPDPKPVVSETLLTHAYALRRAKVAVVADGSTAQALEARAAGAVPIMEGAGEDGVLQALAVWTPGTPDQEWRAALRLDVARSVAVIADAIGRPAPRLRARLRLIEELEAANMGSVGPELGLRRDQANGDALNGSGSREP